jgi:tRNA (adenine22-N1)-methyltransferase
LSQVPRCAHLVDVGCDHALVPIAAVQRGVAERATGVDRAAAPLMQARRQLLACGEARVRLLHASGLEAWDDDTADAVVLAGLGARTIVRIIDTAPERLQRRAVWVVQPNTEWASLRAWARARNFHLHAEHLMEEAGRFFFTGRFQWAVGADPVYSMAEARPSADALVVLGPWLWRARSAVYMRWLEKEARRQRRVFQRAGHDKDDVHRLFESAWREARRGV